VLLSVNLCSNGESDNRVGRKYLWCMMIHMKGILEQALAWQKAGHGVALATVIKTWGSSPRPVGSQLAINDRGAFAGSVSGGCIETFVVSEAIDVIAEGEAQVLEYGVTDEQAQKVRLACGGTVVVFVERAPAQAELEKIIHQQPIARVVDIGTCRAALVYGESIEGDLTLSSELTADVLDRLKRDASGLVRSADAELFISVYAPSRQLIIIGAVHITQALAPMATAIGFAVSVIDSRPLFAAPERLQGVTVVTNPVEQAIKNFTLDCSTAVVVLAHDPILDDPALKAALASPAYYIGCLGSRKTHGERLKRLQAAGFDAAALARLHGPIGLNIGARSPGEIAVSILAEIIAVASGKNPVL